MSSPKNYEGDTHYMDGGGMHAEYAAKFMKNVFRVAGVLLFLAIVGVMAFIAPEKFLRLLGFSGVALAVLSAGSMVYLLATKGRVR